MTIDIKGFGKVTASKEVLNSICLLLGDACELRTRKGDRFGTAKIYTEMAQQVYEELDKVGLYDEYRD